MRRLLNGRVNTTGTIKALALERETTVHIVSLPLVAENRRRASETIDRPTVAKAIRARLTTSFSFFHCSFAASRARYRRQNEQHL